MNAGFTRLSAIEVVNFRLLYFAALHSTAGAISLTLTRRRLPLWRPCRPLDSSPGPVLRDPILSAGSIRIPGLGLIVACGHDRHHRNHGNYRRLPSLSERWFGTARPQADDSRPLASACGRRA